MVCYTYDIGCEEVKYIFLFIGFAIGIMFRYLIGGWKDE